MVEVGQEYRHFKGNLYEIIQVESAFLRQMKEGQSSYQFNENGGFEFLACSDIEPSDQVVFYRSRLGDTYARNFQNFTQIIDGVPRFQLLVRQKP